MPNTGIGAYYYDKRFFAGLSIPQLLAYSPQTARSYKGKLTASNAMLYAGTIIPAGKNFKVKPSTLMRYTSKGIRFDVSCNVLMLNDILELGVSWRTGSTMVAMAQFRINSFYIGIARDHTIGKPGAINASHEIMLRYNLIRIVKASSPLLFLNQNE